MASIKVAVRVRPISGREINATGAEIVVHTDGNEVSLTNLKVSASKAGDSRERVKRYSFDYCFDSTSNDVKTQATQEKVYECLGKTVLDTVFAGFNSCLVAYGQSASGKTFTMMGPKSDPGLTPRLCEGLFFRIFEERKTENHYETSVSYLEIYNEKVRDLLNPSSRDSRGLRVREHPKVGPYVQGLTNQEVSTLGSLMSYVEDGTKARKTASTSQNPTSSRSHAVLTVSLKRRTDNGPAIGLESKHQNRGAHLHLVDLAGSERAGTSNGLRRLKEGANINKSLVALGNVISALAERGTVGSRPGRRFIPYRDSALTWLLKDALGGNATTIMLATISPASSSYNETAHTLRFAQRAQSVVNRPVVNEDPVARVIRELRSEVTRLTSLLAEKAAERVVPSLCCCQQQSNEVREDVRPRDVEGCEPTETRLTGDGRSALSSYRKYGSEESLGSKRSVRAESPQRSLGSWSRAKSTSDVIGSARELSLVKSSSIDYERANSLALVDIPTLVAVLIKPETEEEARIEEICGGNILESSGETETLESFDVALESDDGSVRPNVASGESEKSIGSKDSREPGGGGADSGIALEDSEKGEEEGSENTWEEGIPAKVSVDCTSGSETSKFVDDEVEIVGKKLTSRKFGSTENLPIPGSREYSGLVRRSNTTLERLGPSVSSRGKNLTEASKNKSARSKRNWSLQGTSVASKSEDPSRKEQSLQRGSKNVEGRNRRTSKDSSASSSREESFFGSGGAINSVPRSQVVGDSVGQYRSNRRAEIVAAVTQRLYSTKRTSDEVVHGSVSDFRSPESSEVKLATATRMKLQEISRKMLAKRRKTCVDTQTDKVQTVRMKDAESATDRVEVLTRDVEVLTDVHEGCEFGVVDRPVTRVKEMATLTENSARTVRCREVGILTDDFEDDPGSLNDSGISVSRSDTASLEKYLVASDAWTNTEVSSSRRSFGSQTGELFRDDSSKKVDGTKEGVAEGEDKKIVESRDNKSEEIETGERSVISITVPDMINIRIESSNGLESRVTISEGSDGTRGVVDEGMSSRKTDAWTQTVEKKSEEQKNTETVHRGTWTLEDDWVNYVSTSTCNAIPKSGGCQSDNKTFRIENIFRDEKVNKCRLEVAPDLTEELGAPKKAFKLTNSIGTSFVPETRERSTEMEGENERAIEYGKVTDNNSMNIRRARYTPRRRCCHPKECRPRRRISTKGIQVGASGWRIPRKEESTEGKELISFRDTRVAEETLKSPLLVARIISKGVIDTEGTFSDDSLDQEDKSRSICVPKEMSPRRPEEETSLCPPDVVAHTKQDNHIVEPRRDEDFDDEQVDFPKADIRLSDNRPFSLDEYESMVLGKIRFRTNNPEECVDNVRENIVEDSRSTLKKKVSFSNPDGSRSNRGSSTISVLKPIIKTTDDTSSSGENRRSRPQGTDRSPSPLTRSDSSSRDDNISSTGANGTSKAPRFCLPLYDSDDYDWDYPVRIVRDKSEGKRVTFTTLDFRDRPGPRSLSRYSKSDLFAGENNSTCAAADRPGDIFAAYLAEAAAFVRGMNAYDDYGTRGGGDPFDDLEEEERRRPYHSSYPDEKRFEVPVDSYRDCMRGIERLESCIERAVKQDDHLRGKYEIRSKSADTRPSLVVNRGSDYSKRSRLEPGQFSTTFVQGRSNHSSSSVEDLINFDESKEYTFAKDLLELPCLEKTVEFESPCFRRSAKMTDLRVRTPTTYSKLRNNQRKSGRKVTKLSEGSTQRRETLDSVSFFPPLTVTSRLLSEEVGSSRTTKGKNYRKPGSSSSDTVATSSESIGTVASVGKKFKYPGSPRAKLLQLLDERRQIVQGSRNASST